MTYEYQCSAHGTFERVEPMTVEHKADCPHCGQPAKRLYHPFMVRYAYPIFNEDGSYQEK